MEEYEMAHSPSLHLTCAGCLAKNRVPTERVGNRPICGRCKAQLLPEHPVVLTDANFGQVVEGSELPVIVDFWAAWCSPCRAMAPQFEAASRSSRGRALFAKVDTDAARDTAARHRIQSIPTLIAFRAGREVGRRSGAMSKVMIEEFVAALPG